MQEQENCLVFKTILVAQCKRKARYSTYLKGDGVGRKIERLLERNSVSVIEAAHAGAENNGRDERSDSTSHMHWSRTSKVNGAASP